MTASTLYDIGAELNAIYAAVADAEGELSPENEARLDALGLSWDEKCEKIVLARQMMDRDEEKIATEIERLAALKQSIARRRESFDRYIINAALSTGRLEGGGPLGALTVQRNGAASIACSVPLEDLPPEFVNTTIETKTVSRLDREKVLAASIPPAGVTVEHGYHIRVRKSAVRSRKK